MLSSCYIQGWQVVLTLTTTEFESLTTAEQKCAKMLGLDAKPWKRARKGHTKCTSGESYILVTTTSCRLCGALYTKIFHMLKNGSSLIGEEVPKIPTKAVLGNMKVKNSYYSTRHCKNCRSYLESLKKEDLIQKFLSYISDGKNFLS